MEPQNHPIEWKIIFQTSIFWFHDNFPGWLILVVAGMFPTSMALTISPSFPTAVDSQHVAA